MSSAKKVLSKSFVDNHENVTEDVAGELIVKAEQKIRAIREEKNADEKLRAAKEIAKDLNTGYNTAIRYEQAKIDFLLEKITEIQAGEVNPSSGAKP